MALGPAAHYRRGFHLTATCGAFGAAAAAGAVLGLEAAAIAAALGIAGSQAAGSMEFLADGSWTKRFQTGWAACAGLHAAALAQAGFSGPATILEGRFGFLHAYSDGATTAPLAAHEGYELMRTSVKPHACCRYMQGPIDAVLALRAAHRIEPDQVERVEVGMLAAGFPIVCEPAEAKRRPASVVEAQFSLPFGVAVASARHIIGAGGQRRAPRARRGARPPLESQQFRVSRAPAAPGTRVAEQHSARRPRAPACPPPQEDRSPRWPCSPCWRGRRAPPPSSA